MEHVSTSNEDGINSLISEALLVHGIPEHQIQEYEHDKIQTMLQTKYGTEREVTFKEVYFVVRKYLLKLSNQPIRKRIQYALRDVGFKLWRIMYDHDNV